MLRKKTYDTKNKHINNDNNNVTNNESSRRLSEGRRTSPIMRRLRNSSTDSPVTITAPPRQLSLFFLRLASDFFFFCRRKENPPHSDIAIITSRNVRTIFITVAKCAGGRYDLCTRCYTCVLRRTPISDRKFSRYYTTVYKKPHE